MSGIFAALVDPAALALVAGGSLLIGAWQAGRAAMRAAFQHWSASDEDEAEAAERLIHAARATVAHRGLFAAETLEPRQHFLRAALAELADAHDQHRFEAAMAEIEADAAAADQAPAEFWAAVADAAPGLGMIGTVIGMIGAGSGAGLPAIAVSLTSTLYGLIIATVLAGPLAARANDRAARQLAWRSRFTAAMSDLLAREMAPRRYAA